MLLDNSFGWGFKCIVAIRHPGQVKRIKGGAKVEQIHSTETWNHVSWQGPGGGGGGGSPRRWWQKYLHFNRLQQRVILTRIYNQNMPSIGQGLRKGGIIFLKRAAHYMVKCYQAQHLAKNRFLCHWPLGFSYILVKEAGQSVETAMSIREGGDCCCVGLTYYLSQAWFVSKPTL